jgi:hypothetical protein
MQRATQCVPGRSSGSEGVYARNRLPRRLNVPSALIGNTDPDDRPGTHWVALCIDANSRGEYYDPTGRPPFLRAYVNFMNKYCTSWTYNTIRVQEEGSTVCGHHCIFYLIHRCAGKSMGDVTRTLRHPREATDIVKTFVHRLINKAEKMYLAFCYNVKPRMMNNILFTKKNKQTKEHRKCSHILHTHTTESPCFSGYFPRFYRNSSRF